MLTPYFELSQTDNEIIIFITTKYANIKNTDLFSSGTEFWFYCSPYYLRLNLPGEVKEDDEPETKFDFDKGQFEIHLVKKTPGEQFPDLDLIGKLLAPKTQRHNIKPSIEVIDKGEEEIRDDDCLEDVEDEWFLEQVMPEPSVEVNFNAPKYGFANKTQSVLERIQDEFREIVDLPNPDATPIHQREGLRIAAEDAAFSSDHYLADFMEPNVVEPYLNFTSPLKSLSPDQVKLTKTELEQLTSFGNKEYLLDKAERKLAYLSLVDILYAYAYDLRTTLGEKTVESAWSINKLSATLCWFQHFQSIDSVVKTCLRRSLCYPWCRNWILSMQILRDTIDILKLGRKQILKCLLEIYELFNNSEPRYLLNQLYISDYCIWVQQVPENKIQSLASSLEKIKVKKEDLNFDLAELETAALLVEEEEQEENLAKQMNSLAVQNKRCEDSSDDSEDNSETDSSASDSFDSDDLSSVEE